MAGKSTISISFKFTGDAKELKALINDTEGLKRVMQSTVVEAEQLKKSLINWSHCAQAIDAVTNIARNTSSAIQSFTGNLQELQSASILVTQLTGKTGDEMQQLRNKVQAVASHFGTDFNETLQAANSLSKGFGISIDQAMKLVQDGFVSGANANGEFVDTLKEYPRYFKEAGLSAEQFVAITTTAAQQGVFSDKGVDVIKEGNLRIREMTTATAQALEGIGISAEKVQEGLRTGSLTTFDVMQMVSAKLSELPASSSAVGTAIADIFGGPGEDAGLEYIKTLSSIQMNMDAVKAATQGTAEQQERQIEQQERIKNSLSVLTGLSAAYTNVKPYADLAAQIGITAIGFGGLIKTIKELNVVTAIAKVKTIALAVAHKTVTIATSAWAAVQKVLNLVLTANPIGIVITAIGALVTVVAYAYRNFSGFRKIVDTVGSTVLHLSKILISGLVSALSWVADKAKIAFSWLKRLLGIDGKEVNVKVSTTTTTGRQRTRATTGRQRLPKIDIGAYAGNGSYKPSSVKMPKIGGSSSGGVAKPKWTADAQSLKAIEDNIDILNGKLQNATINEAAAINQQIEGWQKKADAIRDAGKAVEDNTAKWNDHASTLKEIDDNVSILQDRLQTAGIQEAAIINQEIDMWQKKADAIRNAGKQSESASDIFKKSWSGIKSIAGDIESITDALRGNGGAWNTIVGLVDGFIGMFEGIRQITGIINMLTTANIGNAAATATSTTANTAAATGSAAASSAVIVANKLEAASWKELAAAKYMAAHAYIPFAGYGIAAGFVAAMMTTVTAAGIPALANGGIASGPTLAMVGEYAGASGNPEVIAPLDKLRGMLAQPQSVDLSKVEFVIKGRNLVGILGKEHNLKNRS